MNSICEKMISMVDFDGFLESVKVTSERKTGIDESVVRKYLEDWAEAKQGIFQLFGEQLIMQKEVDIVLDAKSISRPIENLKKQFPQYAAQLSEFSDEEYAANKVLYNDGRIAKALLLSTYKEGMKLSKCLSCIFQDVDFDIELSKILQNRTVKGNISLSIHPLDFVTISTCSHKWGSCMHIVDGFNKFGGYSLMLDKESFVVYADSGDYIIENRTGSFKWNDKIWRQIFYISEDRNQLVAGHYNGTPPKDLASIVFEMLNLGEDFAAHDDYATAKKMGEFYYNYEVYSRYIKKGKKFVQPQMGVKSLRCVVCGQPFTNLVGYKNWLTCQKHK